MGKRLIFLSDVFKSVQSSGFPFLNDYTKIAKTGWWQLSELKFKATEGGMFYMNLLIYFTSQSQLPLLISPPCHPPVLPFFLKHGSEKWRSPVDIIPPRHSKLQWD